MENWCRAELKMIKLRFMVYLCRIASENARIEVRQMLFAELDEKYDGIAGGRVDGAFPSISTGAFGYFVEEAARVAVKTVQKILTVNPDKIDVVLWILFDNHTLAVYEKAIRG